MKAPGFPLFGGGESGAVVEDGFNPGGVFATVGHAGHEAKIFLGALVDGMEVAAVGQLPVFHGLEVLKASGGRLGVPLALAGATAVCPAVGALHRGVIPFQ